MLDAISCSYRTNFWEASVFLDGNIFYSLLLLLLLLLLSLHLSKEMKCTASTAVQLTILKAFDAVIFLSTSSVWRGYCTKFHLTVT
jgi:hypothetical protein